MTDPDDPGWQSRRLWQASGDFVHRFSDWALFGTLTFTIDVSPMNARLTLKRWAWSLARNHLRAHFRLAYAMELTAVGVPHFHVLIGPPVSAAQHGHPLCPDRAACCWRAGFTRMERFQKRRGAAFYLVKTEGWDVGTVCPRGSQCRRTRCLFGRPPW
jgi:hypothetical protein